MKFIIVGMGVQGLKRKKYLGNNFVCFVDKFKKKAQYTSIFHVPKNLYDAVLVCVPDKEKYKIIEHCIKNKKHILVEKPLFFKNNNKLLKLKRLIKKNKTICYVAYNHRFEPGILKISNLLKKKKIGKIYKCRIFYGNGTSKLVKKSDWRDKGKGVITDLGSHLIDLSLFWFGKKISNIKKFDINYLENNSPDHALFQLKIANIKIDLEATLCMWKNTFQCDIIGSKGSIHLNSLTKWSNSSLLVRRRKIPSGIPKEKEIIYKKGDPTWKEELKFFKDLIIKNKKISIEKNILINKILNNI
jgi:scyllo-inositol 2-dehydrogenase (NADP+)